MILSKLTTNLNAHQQSGYELYSLASAYLLKYRGRKKWRCKPTGLTTNFNNNKKGKNRGFQETPSPQLYISITPVPIKTFYLSRGTHSMSPNLRMMSATKKLIMIQDVWWDENENDAHQARGAFGKLRSCRAHGFCKLFWTLAPLEITYKYRKRTVTIIGLSVAKYLLLPRLLFLNMLQLTRLAA